MPDIVVRIVAGLHVPVMAGILVELVSKTGGVLYWHNGPICENIGIVFGLMVTVNVAVVAGPSAAEGNVGVSVGNDHRVATGGMPETGDISRDGGHFQIINLHSRGSSEEHIMIENEHGFHLPADILVANTGRGGVCFDIEHIEFIVVAGIEIVSVQTEPGH